MKTITTKPVILLLSFITAVATLLQPGCTGTSPANHGNPEAMRTGAAQATVNVGKIGTLAKRTAIEMERLIITISVKETGSVIVADTSDLSGSGDTTVKKTFPELTAPEEFTLTVTTLDAEEETIHSGSKDFSSIPADTVKVDIDLDAKYSMLKVSFNDIPDSVTSVSLGIDEVDTLDESFDAGDEEKVTFEYDYLEADADGIEYAIALRASGSFYGNDTVLYAADTTIIALSGVDTNYVITLQWVGPDIPHGVAEITVTIGAVGTTEINAEFVLMSNRIPTAGLTAYFPFNGNITDMSGSGISATNHGATLASDRFGNSNAAYSFNGTSDYIDLGTANPVTGNHFTISLWVYITDTVSTYVVNGWYGTTIIMKGNQAGTKGSYGFNILNGVQNEQITFANASASFAVFPNDASDCYYTGSSQGIFSPHKWYHITGTLNDDNMHVFINGQFASSTVITGLLSTSDLPLAIGRKGTPAQHFFTGRIDDIRIYDRALSDDEILALYHENGWTGN